MADVLGSVVEGIAQIPGATLLHAGIAVFELPGLIGRRRHPRIDQQLVRGIEPGEVTDLGQYHGTHLTLFNAAISEGTPQMLEHNDVRWITVGEITKYEFCPADEVILKKLRGPAIV